MEHEAIENTVAQTDNVVEPVKTDTESQKSEAKSETTETVAKTPAVEQRDNKLFVDNTRVYTRDDINKIAANAKHEAINNVLKELDVDSLDQVKSVITQLKDADLGEGNSIDVQALKQAVAKREATVEELQSQVKNLQTELLLKDHMSNLYNAMPGGWNSDQKQAVVDLMKARNMFAIENNSFQLRNGNEFLTVDGETPDYATAVETVGKSLGLNFGKKGVSVVNAEQSADDGDTRQVKPLDENRLNSDTEYRSAYMHIRQFKPNLSRADITNNMVVKQMETSKKQRMTT